MFEFIYRCDEIGGPQPARPQDARQARERLMQGNQRFVDYVKNASDIGASHQEVISIDPAALGIAEEPGAIPPQEPFAAVLSCSDARVPVELVFHQVCNDLFVVRLAGNVITNECVGSIGYSINNLDSVKLVVVLGHTYCGAVTGAVDSYLRPANYYPGIASALGLRSILDRVFVSVRSGAQALDRIAAQEPLSESDYRDRLLKSSVILNTAMMAMSLQQLIAEFVADNCPVVYGVYDLATRVVWAPSSDLNATPWDAPQLSEAPLSLEEFETLAGRLASVNGL